MRENVLSVFGVSDRTLIRYLNDVREGKSEEYLKDGQNDNIENIYSETTQPKTEGEEQ